MTEENTILYKSKSFVLGVCNCNCKTEISLRTVAGFLRRFKSGHQNRGKNNGRYIGGRSDFSGYDFIWKPEHYHTDERKYIFEHRYVMEKHLGRKLESYESVHHKDKNKKNNNIFNLQLMTRPEHLTHHAEERRKEIDKRRCKICGKQTTHFVKNSNGIKNVPVWYRYEDGYICGRCGKREGWKKRSRIKRG